MIETVYGDTRVTWERDLKGDEVTESFTLGGEVIAVSSTYDADGQRARRTVGDHTVDLNRNDRGHVIERTLDGKRRQALQRDVMGRLVGWGSTNVIATFTYEPGRLLSSTTLARRGGSDPAAKLIDRRFEYTAESELAFVLDAGAGETRFIYDPVRQLLERMTPRLHEAFQYDASGNQLPSGGRAVVDPGNRLRESQHTSLEYDAVGRVVSKVQHRDGRDVRWRFGWDGSGSLEEVVTPDGKTCRFSYDGLGRRVRKTCSDGEEVRFVWDGDVLAKELRLRAGAVVEERIYLFDEERPFVPVAQRVNGRWFDYVTEPNGTPTELLDDTGQVGWAATFRAYGELETESRISTDTPIRFQGQYWDAETGLSYNRARYYDPEIGRYLSPDPISIEGGLNEYAYTVNPVGHTDPLGLKDGGPLADAIEAAGGGGLPSGYQAHHVIPESLYTDPDLKKLLGGKNQNTNANGIYLPETKDDYKKGVGGKTCHLGGHQGYTNDVKRKLLEIQKIKEKCKREKALEDYQAGLKQELQDGTHTFTNKAGTKTTTGLNKGGVVK
jgi:RHS repeat-associated protein